MQRILCGLVTAAALSPAFAASEINLGVSSEYVFRGIPQSDGAQVWGSFDYYMESWGTYAGMWVSNAGLGGNEEVDVYAGYALTLGETLSLDFGGIGYFDPSAPESGVKSRSRFRSFTSRPWTRTCSTRNPASRSKISPSGRSSKT